MKKKITKKGYRTLAVVWTLAAASIGVAFVRNLAEFNLLLLLLLVLSVLTAASFWRAFHMTPETENIWAPFDGPPTFGGEPVSLDDLPLQGTQLFAGDDQVPTPNKDSEENDHE